MIHIFTGPIHSGKTTMLQEWSEARTDCSGILSPIIDGKRYFYSILKKQLMPMETVKNTSDTITVGKYAFSADTFEWATQQLKQASASDKLWLLVDEIGPLELNNKGLEPIIGEIIHQYKSDQNKNLLLVIRETLLDELIRNYRLHDHSRVARQISDL